MPASRVESLDLVQLYCPPTDLYYHPDVFDDLEGMVGEWRIAAYGVRDSSSHG